MKIQALALAALAISATVAVRADDSDTVEYRQHVMKTLDEEMAAIGMILENRAPADALPTHTRILAISAGMVKKAFEAQAASSGAKPDIWTHGPQFATDADALVAATGKLAQAADAGSAAALKTDVATACKNCHEQFRVPKK